MVDNLDVGEKLLRATFGYRRSAMRFGTEWLRSGVTVNGRYKVLDIVGTGAVGTVVRAVDEELERQVVALKVLHQHLVIDPTSFARFQNEVMISRQLSHPNIVRVYDFDQVVDEEIYFLSMECISGPNLQEYLDVHKGRRLAAEDAARIIAQLGHALSFAHDKGIVHRDIKAANILICDDGTVKLSDFGIAQSLTTSHGLTATGESLGTPLYMSPEHFGRGQLDLRSDIYSLGILAFEMVCGRPPFVEENYLTLAQKHLSEEIPLPLLKEAGTPTWYVELVQRCTEKDKEKRFLDTKELLDSVRKSASRSLINPQVNMGGGLKGKFQRRGHITRKQQLFFQILLSVALLSVTVASLRETNPRAELLRNLFKLEWALGTELTYTKKLFGFPPLSVLAPEDLLEAGRMGLSDVVKAFLVFGVDRDYQDPKSGNTVLHIGAENNSFFICITALAQNVDPELRNNKGETALHLAMKNQNGAAVLTFVKPEYADVSLAVQDNDGNTPLHLAAQLHKSSWIYQIMANHPFRLVHPYVLNNEGDMPIHISVRNGDIEAIEHFIEAGGFLDVTDSLGRTPIMVALAETEESQEEIIKLLLSSGVSLKTRDFQGRSVSDYAKIASSEKISSILFEEIKRRSLSVLAKTD